MADRGLDGTLHGTRPKPLRQRVDGLDLRKRRKAGFVNDTIGMHHLQHPVIRLDLAGDPALLTDRKRSLDPFRTRSEKDKRQVAGVVARVDAVRSAAARTRPMALH